MSVTYLRKAAVGYVSPYVREAGDTLTNFISGISYTRGDERGRVVAQLRENAHGSGSVARTTAGFAPEGWLFDESWLFRSEEELWSAHRLRYASIETVSACNQSCYFCPVSVAPRPVTRMPDILFDRIIDQLGELDSVEGIFLNNYNEPFLDKRLPRMVTAIAKAGIKVAVNTNASVPFDGPLWQREGAQIALLTINLHTVNAKKYAEERGKDDLEAVFRNIELYRKYQIAETLRIAVLGHDDEQHHMEFDQIASKFAHNGIDVQAYTLMDRCGEVTLDGTAVDRGPFLAGCEQTGSRAVEHIHVLTDGRCVLCCEDYSEKYVVGDLREQSVSEVMAGKALSAHRQKLYGGARCDESHICRHCSYATAGTALATLALEAG